MKIMKHFCAYIILFATYLLSFQSSAQVHRATDGKTGIDTSGFSDSAHHWYDIYDEDKLINAFASRPKYEVTEIGKIADNILLFQKSNGGWPKNYDMCAILTDAQRDTVLRAKDELNTCFDNGATHSQVTYLAKVFSQTGERKYKDACMRGIDFMLSAQYPNGGWPQYYPDTSGYRKYITFNDGAMVGVMKVFHDILTHQSEYGFIDSTRYQKVKNAFEKGIDCILKCQITQNGELTAWGQQHDNVDLHPQSARKFEPAAICGDESADIILLLMSIDRPTRQIIHSIQRAVRWLYDSRILGIRVETIEAPKEVYKYSTSTIDRIVVQDSTAPPIWARLYELGTNRPLFCNRDAIPVYSLAEVDRERRSGYTWYHYEPERVFKKYPEWQQQWDPGN